MNSTLKRIIIRNIKYNVVIFIIFFIIYTLLLRNGSNHFKLNDPQSNNSLINTFYFTLVTHSTLGYGDIYPTSNLGKLVVSLHVIVVMIMNIVSISF